MVNDLDSIGLVFRALESPVRRQLLQGIAAKRQPIRDLAKPLHISLPAVTKHLKILEQAKLIRREKVQRYYYFTINVEPLDEAAAWIETHTKFWQKRLAGLEKYLKANKSAS
ncbi:MAG: ArsR family transcriptional regulator [Candidatus Peribacteria bacterium]|nr:ArsR family transcriptional regulator [Candidatus Peribacteria bacterium]